MTDLAIIILQGYKGDTTLRFTLRIKRLQL